ncbi:MAG: DUF975 family protein [Clostridium sp.]
MNVFKTSYEIRKEAREVLKGNWKKATGLTMLLILLLFVPMIVAIFAFPTQETTVSVILQIWVMLITGPVALGFSDFFINLQRNGNGNLKDGFKGFSNFLKAFGLYFMTTLFTNLWSILLIIPGIIAAFNYSQTFYILADNPNIKVLDAIRESKKMMYGHRGRYLLLQLSFIGWGILSIFTLGLGFIWLFTYIYASEAVFYNDIRINEDKQ